MSRWLPVFLLLLALFGFGLAMQAPTTSIAAAPDMAMVHLAATDNRIQAATPELSVPAEGSTSHPDGRALLQAEADTVVDVTVLFEPTRSPGTLVIVAATPSRFGWTPVATPFIEGLQRPPRQALLRA